MVWNSRLTRLLLRDAILVGRIQRVLVEIRIGIQFIRSACSTIDSGDMGREVGRTLASL